MFDTSTDADQAYAALHCIPPDLAHDEWVRVGMACHAAGLSRDTWNDWSAGAANYQPSAARDAWHSFKPGGGVGAGTLFHIAKEYGYTPSGTPPDLALIEACKAKQQADAAAHAVAEKQRQQQAAQAAEAALKAATPAPADLPYLVRKGIEPHGTMMDKAGYLLVPMRDTDRKLWNVERISPDGKDKKGLPGGRRTGLYFGIGKPDDGVLLIGEGFATMASNRECTGHAVAVAFTAGNLKAVALALRAKYPAMKLVICADDDVHTPGNPGLTKATEAACAVNGLLAVPDFGADRPDGAKDFNDLHQIHGAAAVRGCIDVATLVSSTVVSNSVSSQTTFPPLDDDTATVWPTPEPLPDSLPPVQAFDPELLPVALRAWVLDIAHRMQCPPDFVAVAAVAALSSLIGARAVIAPKQHDDWRVVPNLWGVIVGKPGVMKSPALGEAMKPLNRLEANEREATQDAHADWVLDCKVAKLADEATERDAKKLAAKDPAAARAMLATAPEADPEPKARRFVVNDSSVEKLADLLTYNTWGLLVFRDELHGLIAGMDKAGQEGSRGFYLTAYDGNQGYAVDRILRGESYVPRVCLAMLGGMQPGKLQAYVREAVAGGAGDDGLLQRFGLAVWPDVTTEFCKVDQWPDASAKQTAWAVFDRLAVLQPANDDDPVEWRFSPAAQALFWEWALPFETEIRGDTLHPALISHLSKYRKLVPALALIFAMVDTPDNGNVVDEPELLRALAWADYLRSHAERIYSAATKPETAGASALLAKIQTGKLCDTDGVMKETFTPRQVAAKGWTGLSTPDDVRKSADVLADYGWLVSDVQGSGAKGGRPSERYRISPFALKGGI